MPIVDEMFNKMDEVFLNSGSFLNKIKLLCVKLSL